MKSLDLSGKWRLHWDDGERNPNKLANRPVVDEARYIDADVPGEVHLDCLNEGWIPDPYVGSNILAARWIEECIWSYRRTFEAPTQALSNSCWLVFEGLDYAAEIFLNGEQVGSHKNVFYPCRVDITGKLKAGSNLLTVHLDPGLYEVADKPVEGYFLKNQWLHKRHWLRKPQCQFGWDWSARFINAGIFKPVRMEWAEVPVRPDQLVPLATLSENLTEGRLKIRWFVEGIGKEDLPARLIVRVPQAQVETATDVTIQPGLHPCEAEVVVPSPKLWWPIGLGTPHRYEVQISLQMNGLVIEERTVKVGFRHIEINQAPHPSGGRFFVIVVNGRQIFAKGGNLVPADMIFARLDRDRYATLVDRAVEANFNFLRVWGGGLYESDDLYDLCDERGLMVWQEFIFACGKYPLQDEDYYRNVKNEAVYNIRRLASHPSLVVWCGNNEMEWAAWDWGFDTGVVLPDYALFHLTLPRMLKEEDPTRYYQPSSPYSPDGEDPNTDNTGDQHPWSIGFGDTDFRKYRSMTCRFPNEGGILGPTSLPTMKACLHGHPEKIGSFPWQIHDNSIGSNEEPASADAMMLFWLGRSPQDMTLEEFTYWGGLLQGEGLREYCDNFHRRMYDSASAIFWMYNDCWPSSRSWTIVDYYLNRTPSFHPVRRAMAPVNLVLAVEGDSVTIFGINETLETITGHLQFGVFNLTGDYPVDESLDVTLPPNKSTPVASFPLSRWKNTSSSASFAILSKDDRLIARNRLFLPLFKDIEWPEARVSIRVENDQAIFESLTFAWGVCLDLDGVNSLPDNFFDVYPGIAYSIPWKEPEPPIVLKIGNLQ